MVHFATACVATVAVLCVLLPSATSMYLPGVAPVDYKAGASLPLKVRQITSNHDVAFAYYDLPFCAVCCDGCAVC